jgi:hypothetical protein
VKKNGWQEEGCKEGRKEGSEESQESRKEEEVEVLSRGSSEPRLFSVLLIWVVLGNAPHPNSLPFEGGLDLRTFVR